MSVLDLPRYTIDLSTRIEMRPDAPVWWTIEQMLEHTEPYCFQSEEQEDFATGLVIPAGWWVSDKALQDIERESLN